MKNSERCFVKIIKEICIEENIECHTFSSDWVFSLYNRKTKVHAYIIGYQFGLNTSSVHSICCDKSAASAIMTSLGIPNVEHFFFLSPINQKYVGENGNWQNMIELLHNYHEVVCKDNEGTGGNLVFHVHNEFELEQAVHNIFKNTRSMAISPYVTIDNEYRIIVLDGEIKLIYSKERECLIGDGESTVGQLLLSHLHSKGIKFIPKNLALENINNIPVKDSKLFLNWKHNLGQGAEAKIIEVAKIEDSVKTIIDKVINMMNVRFASIDIVKIDNEYKVLEINSGVMMEHFAQQSEQTYTIAKDIYRNAIIKMLN